jgi:hypothetical protein
MDSDAQLPLPGPDGFLSSRADPYYAAHLLLNDYLVAEEEREAAGPLRTWPNISKWKKLPKRQQVDLVNAALVRLTWLRDHRGEMENARASSDRFRRVLRQLHAAKIPFTAPELLLVLQLTTALLGTIEPYGAAEQVNEYLKKNDLTPELCRALHEFQGNLREEMSVNQASMQLLWQRLHVWLWLDEWDAIDPKRCWSEQIRSDYRAMAGERRDKWRALFKHLRGDASAKMPANWTHEAETRLAGAGVEDFREQIRLWFGPFRSGQALPLSVAGSHVLKGLLWYCALARDLGVNEAGLWLLDAKWKQKRNVDKVMVALVSLVEAMPAAEAWEPALRLQEAWGKSKGQIEKLLERVAAELGVSKQDLEERKLLKPAPPPATLPFSVLHGAIARRISSGDGQLLNSERVQLDGDMAIIQGDLDFYRLFLSSGRIERVRDNAVLELNFADLPGELRGLVRPECDGRDQAVVRATMLVLDAVYGKFFVRRGE